MTNDFKYEPKDTMPSDFKIQQNAAIDYLVYLREEEPTLENLALRLYAVAFMVKASYTQAATYAADFFARETKQDSTSLHNRARVAVAVRIAEQTYPDTADAVE